MRLRNYLSCLSLVIVGLGVSAAIAQGPRKTPPTTPPAAGSPAGQRAPAAASNMDQTVATCVSIDNQAEVALADFVQEKTKNDDVKEFAAMLAKDHRSFLKKLEQFTPEAARDTLAAAGSSDSDRDSAVRPAAGTNPPGLAIQPAGGAPAQASGSLDIVQLHRELASQCLADTKRMLSEKSAEEFDACFVGLQIAQHGAMASKLTVLQRHASSDFAAVLKDAQGTVKEHQEHAEKLMKQLASVHDGKGSSKAEQRKAERKAEREERKSQAD